MSEHSLSAERLHFAWDNSLEPVLEIDPGDAVAIETWDANGHFYTPASTGADVAKPKPHNGHALSGPIYVHGAQRGDTLVVEVLEVVPDSWGWTAHGPRGGLLPMDFPVPYLRTWDLTDRCFARGVPGAKVPLAPFCGVMGVALAEPGSHSTVPPRRVGGNMDVRQLTAGSTLYLPIEVEGALFSVGDAHGVQGDGEVCISAVEMDSTTSLRFSVRRDFPVNEPQLTLPGPPTSIGGRYHGCTAHAPDLMDAARNATRYLIDWLCRTTGVTAEDAYVLASVAAELRISQVVDAPNWTVTCFFPLAVLTD
jgi:acetamidase/formamidase